MAHNQGTGKHLRPDRLSETSQHLLTVQANQQQRSTECHFAYNNLHSVTQSPNFNAVRELSTYNRPASVNIKTDQRGWRCCRVRIKAINHVQLSKWKSANDARVEQYCAKLYPLLWPAVENFFITNFYLNYTYLDHSGLYYLITVRSVERNSLYFSQLVLSFDTQYLVLVFCTYTLIYYHFFFITSPIFLRSFWQTLSVFTPSSAHQLLTDGQKPICDHKKLRNKLLWVSTFNLKLNIFILFIIKHFIVHAFGFCICRTYFVGPHCATSSLILLILCNMLQ